MQKKIAIFFAAIVWVLLSGAQTLTSPNGGETWLVGSTHQITFTGVGNAVIDYSTNNGTSWTSVVFISASPYNWTIPNTLSNQCLVRISWCGGCYDYSDAVFTISNSLPVQWLDVESKCDGQDIVIEWTVASQLNNNFFVLEYSIDGMNFFSNDTIDGAGNSNEVLQYSYIDKNIRHEWPIYYRIKQVDYNGQGSYSKLVSAACEERDKIYIYSIPNGRSIVIENITEPTQIVMTDLLGGEFLNQKTATTCFKFSNLPTGIYVIQLISSQTSISKIIIVQ